MYVTEDTTRADPDTLRAIYRCAIRAGAKRICIADTVGHATPAGAAAVVRFVAEVIAETGADVGIDWHGHRDRDLAVMNSIAALEAGATRLHGDGARHRRARRQHADGPAARQPRADGLYRRATCGTLNEYCQAVVARRAACRFPTTTRSSAATRSARPPASTPRRSSRRGGKGDRELMDAVYSAIPASLVGREQEIDVGPMSGKSNVIFWLEKRGITPTDAVVDRVFRRRRRRRRC